MLAQKLEQRNESCATARISMRQDESLAIVKLFFANTSRLVVDCTHLIISAFHLDCGVSPVRKVQIESTALQYVPFNLLKLSTPFLLRLRLAHLI